MSSQIATARVRRVASTSGDDSRSTIPRCTPGRDYARVRAARRRWAPAWSRSAALAIEHRRVSRNAARGSSRRQPGPDPPARSSRSSRSSCSAAPSAWRRPPRLPCSRPTCRIPRPSAPDLRPADRHLRPDRRGPARGLPAESAASSSFDDVPRLVLDATTTAEDRSFWENGGFDPAAILAAAAENANGESDRGASTITQQLVRARLLPAERHRRRGQPLHPQGEGADPVVAPDRRVPGRERQGADHHRLPQRDLLRPRRLRDRGGRRDLLRGQGPLEADAGPGRPPCRPAEVALDARSVPLRRAGRGRQARGHAGLRRRSSAATGSSTTSRPRAGRTLSRRQLRERPRRTGRARRRRAALVPRAALHVAGPAAARGDPQVTMRSRSRRRLQGHHDARLEHPGAGRALARRRRSSPPTSRAQTASGCSTA